MRDGSLLFDWASTSTDTSESTKAKGFSKISSPNYLSKLDSFVLHGMTIENSITTVGTLFLRPRLVDFESSERMVSALSFLQQREIWRCDWSPILPHTHELISEFVLSSRLVEDAGERADERIGEPA